MQVEGKVLGRLDGLTEGHGPYAILRIRPKMSQWGFPSRAKNPTLSVALFGAKVGMSRGLSVGAHISAEGEYGEANWTSAGGRAHYFRGMVVSADGRGHVRRAVGGTFGGKC